MPLKEDRIRRRFNEFRGRICLIPFITAGYPSIETTYELVLEFEQVGAAMVEIGLPFSDPIADGIVIQRASEESLRRGTNLNGVLSLIDRLRTKTSIPLILLTYFNPVYRRGIKRFITDALMAGLDGIIIPDLPPEEAGDLKKEAKELSTIFLLSPTSSIQRIRLVCEFSTGFIYYVSLTGITGMRERLSSDILPHIETIRRFTNLPIAVGFGISNRDHVVEVASFADGVIVGSAIIDIILKNERDPQLINIVGKFLSSLIRRDG